MKYSIDRFENGYAVLISETGEKKEVDARKLPSSLNEGDVLFFENGQFRLSDDETAELRKANYERMKNLFKK